MSTILFVLNTTSLVLMHIHWGICGRIYTLCQSLRIAKFFIPTLKKKKKNNVGVTCMLALVQSLATQFYLSILRKGNGKRCCMKSVSTVWHRIVGKKPLNSLFLLWVFTKNILYLDQSPPPSFPRKSSCHMDWPISDKHLVNLTVLSVKYVHFFGQSQVREQSYKP